MTEIKKLNYHVERVLPQVYADSLSHIEQADAVARKMNELIEEFNGYFSEDMTKHVSGLLEKWKENGTLEHVINDTIFAELNSIIKDVENRTKGQVSIIQYEKYKDGEDWTTAFNKLVEETPEGYKITFPTDTYKGHFITDKSYSIDPSNSEFIPLRNEPIFKFEGSLAGEYVVVGNPKYGDTTIKLLETSGLLLGDIIYMQDRSVRPKDENQGMNVELLKIKNIDYLNHTITVNDMVRSNMWNGLVTITKLNVVGNPSLANAQFTIPSWHTQPIVWFEKCVEPISSNLSISRFTGNAVRHVYCYNPRSSDLWFKNPSAVGSGQGYGLVFNKCRNGIAKNLYGDGTRHTFDADSSYNCVIDTVHEDFGRATPVMLSHNGYGGNMKVSNLTCSSDAYAVAWSGQGVEDKSKVVVRDVIIENVRQSVPTTKTDAEFTSIVIQLDFSNIEIDNVNVTFSAVTNAPAIASKVVMLIGNQQGKAIVKNISANEVGTLLRVDVRSNQHSDDYFIANNLVCEKGVNLLNLRGLKTVDIDNIVAKVSSEYLITINSLNGSDPVSVNIGDNLFNRSGAYVNVLTVTELRGKAPVLSVGSTSVFYADNNTIVPIEKIMMSSSYLPLVNTKTTGEIVTLNSVTPFAKPSWRGQKVTLVVNGMGGNAQRGNIVIPPNTETYSKEGDTLVNGKIYTMIAYNGKWKIMSN